MNEECDLVQIVPISNAWVDLNYLNVRSRSQVERIVISIACFSNM